MRLCATNRLVTEASMSLPPGTSWAGSHSLLFQLSAKAGR